MIKYFQRALMLPTNAYMFAAKQQTKIINLVFKKLKQLSNQYQSLSEKLNVLGSDNPDKERQRRRLNKLSSFVNLYQKMDSLFKNIADLQIMKKDNPDKQTIEFAQQQINKINRQLQLAQQQAVDALIEPSLYDDHNQILIELRPGVGGGQSSLFVEDIVNMFEGYFSQNGWKFKYLETQRDFNLNKGFKFCSMKVSGQKAYKLMKCESGVHKVIRVPETESKGRLHSSTITVAVMPDIPFDFTVNEKDIRYDFMRAQGAGGQHVNKTESACRATHIPTGLSVFIQQERVQQRNKKRATELLKTKVFQQEFYKNMQEESRRRKIQIGTGDRSEKIRTYNFPQDRITDHRTGLTLYGIERMMSGQYLPRFIKEFEDKVNRLKLQQLLQKLKKQ